MLTVSEDGIFIFYGINLVHITSASVFYKNYGSVNEAIDSDVYLSGNVTVSNNVGLRGIAIIITGNSCLHFLNGVSANFKNNHTLLEGGGVYMGNNIMTGNVITFEDYILWKCSD